METAKRGAKRKRIRVQESKENIAGDEELKNSEAKTAAKYSVDSIIKKAEKCISRFQYEVAQKFCQRAVDLEPDNLHALETYASLCLELGEIEKAKQFLQHSITVSPNVGHTKYLSLAQLLQGKEAVEFYLTGIQIMVQDREKQNKEELAAACGKWSSSRELSTAYCSVAELYMTDCCFDESAEQLCWENVGKAVEADETNPEAYQCMANFLLVKEEREEAKIQMQKSLTLWFPQHQAVREGREAAGQADPVEVCPLSYETRTNAAKILIELEEWDDAVQVLEGLVEEDDEVVETWHLLGWLHYLQGHDHKKATRYYLNQAIKVNSEAAYSDEELKNHIEELLEELETEDTLDSDEDSEKENVQDCEIESSDEEMDEAE